MTNEDIAKLNDGLPTLGNLSGVKFAYAIARNIAIVEREVKAFKDSIKSTPEFEEYEKQRIELCIKHAKKTEQGSPMTANGSYVMENAEDFNKDFEQLKEENKEVLEARKKQEEDFNNFLKEESKVELYKLSEDLIPENITVSQMNVIKDLIS